MLLLNRFRTALTGALSRWADPAERERGDVPGWVLVAVMSAGLVILLWAVAGPLLTEVFEDAIRRVTGNP